MFEIPNIRKYISSHYVATNVSWIKFTRFKVCILTAILVLTRCFAAILYCFFFKCHVIKISKIFGDFVSLCQGLLPTRRHFEHRRGEGPGDEVERGMWHLGFIGLTKYSFDVFLPHIFTVVISNFDLIMTWSEVETSPKRILSFRVRRFLRSRGTRERILIWFHRREKSRFVDCKLAAPVGFCRGFGPRFRVHLSRHACSLLWLLLLFSTFWWFLWS